MSKSFNNFSNVEFKDLLSGDLWLLEKILEIPSDSPPHIIDLADQIDPEGRVVKFKQVFLNDTLGNQDSQKAVEEYRDRLLPLVFLSAQKVYSELFRYLLSKNGVLVDLLQIKVEEGILENEAKFNSFEPFLNKGEFESFWANDYSYSKLRRARNRIAHHEFQASPGQFKVYDKDGITLIDWNTVELLKFVERVLHKAHTIV